MALQRAEVGAELGHELPHGPGVVREGLAVDALLREPVLGHLEGLDEGLVVLEGLRALGSPRLWFDGVREGLASACQEMRILKVEFTIL